MVVDYQRYLGEHLYWFVKKDMEETRSYQQEVGFWHEAMTPERVMGMIMAAGFTPEELLEMIGDAARRGEVIMEAFDVILDAAKAGDSFEKTSKRHPAQVIPVSQTLSHEATRAVITMRPLV